MSPKDQFHEAVKHALEKEMGISELFQKLSF
ncbi:hypothetical protein OsccyDRAFT_2872 [Leptolyngbyaceae cyanobacterium JSC-12]|nr:hypothetical protein OsccyDRAFT_2872 [Leptolyngbyaceae cyanobacterium JSC-12]